MNMKLTTAHGIRPTAQVEHRDKKLLARGDRHIGVLVVVEVLVLGRDMVDAGSNIAIERTTGFDRTDIDSMASILATLRLSDGAHRR